jgi:hypothetical protein
MVPSLVPCGGSTGDLKSLFFSHLSLLSMTHSRLFPHLNFSFDAWHSLFSTLCPLSSTHRHPPWLFSPPSLEHESIVPLHQLCVCPFLICIGPITSPCFFHSSPHGFFPSTCCLCITPAPCDIIHARK